MIAAATLLGYAVLLLTAGAAALARARWPERAPRLAVSAWLALAGTAAVSVALGGLALAVPGARLGGEPGQLIEACLVALRAQYAHPGSAVLACVGLVLAFAVPARISWCTLRELAGAARARRRYRRGLAFVGSLDRRLGAVVVDHGVPAAWCLPGAGRPVVVTTAAIRALNQPQLAAVLAHERAHQRGRHHLLVSLTSSLAMAFPYVRAFRTAQEQVGRLVELLADDAAAIASPRLTVAEAMLALSAPAPVAAAALGAGGRGTAARIRRLIARPAPLGRGVTAVGALAVAALIAFPAAVLTAPVAAFGSNCPPLGTASVAAHAVQR